MACNLTKNTHITHSQVNRSYAFEFKTVVLLTAHGAQRRYDQPVRPAVMTNLPPSYLEYSVAQAIVKQSNTLHRGHI
jgi:hypothetical protein